MHLLRTLYWLLVGALLGAGFILVLTVYRSVLALGVGAAIFGLFCLRDRGVWAIVPGFAIPPALILYVGWDPPSAIYTSGCTDAGRSVPCGDNPLIPHPQIALLFAAIALGGLLLGIAIEVSSEALRRRLAVARVRTPPSVDS